MNTKFSLRLRPNVSILLIGITWIISGIFQFVTGLFNSVMYSAFREDGATFGIIPLIVFISSPFVFTSAILFLRKIFLSRAVIELFCWIALILNNIYLIDFIFYDGSTTMVMVPLFISHGLALSIALIIDVGILIMLLNLRNPELRKLFAHKNSLEAGRWNGSLRAQAKYKTKK